MGLFDSWFGKSSAKGKQPDIKFGRYSDSYKSPKQYDAWQKALDQFDESNHFASYENFFYFLGDPKTENVQVQRLGDTHLSFELYQGSKKIKGYCDGKKFRVEAKVVRADYSHLGFMRRLLEKNFTLQYSRFSFDGNGDVSIVFDTYVLDGSPQKLYHAIKELALNADKMDDLLEAEFDMLHPIANEHIQLFTEQQKEIKYQYTKRCLKDAFNKLDYGKLDANIFPQAIGYILLDTIYKIDYLVRPEGYMMEVFEKINRDYFAQDTRSIAQKNNEFRKELEKVNQLDKEACFNEMYGTLSTFGVTQTVDHERLAGFIDEVIKE